MLTEVELQHKRERKALRRMQVMRGKQQCYRDSGYYYSAGIPNQSTIPDISKAPVFSWKNLFTHPRRTMRNLIRRRP